VAKAVLEGTEQCKLLQLENKCPERQMQLLDGAE